MTDPVEMERDDARARVRESRKVEELYAQAAADAARLAADPDDIAETRAIARFMGVD